MFRIVSMFKFRMTFIFNFRMIFIFIDILMYDYFSQYIFKDNNSSGPVNLKWLQALSDNVTAIATRFHQRQGR